MKIRIGTFIVVMTMVLGAFGSAHAVSSYATAFKTKYPSSPLSSLSTQSGVTGNLCTLCHGTTGGSRNTFGSNFASSSIGNHTFNSTLEARDSDTDGFTNLAEITVGTFPGNAASKPAAATCTSYTYSAWSACQSNNTQTRTVLSSLPTGCSGGLTPITSQACTYVPPVTACTSYTYSAWSACQSNNTQTRTVVTSLPSGCSGGATPVTSQACTYVPPHQPTYPGVLIPPATGGLYWDDTYWGLGIGTTIPEFEVEINGEDINPAILIKAANGIPAFFSKKSRGTLIAPSAVQTEDYLFWLGGAGYKATSWNAQTGVLSFNASENWTDTSTGTDFRIFTTANGTTVRAEQVRLTGDGKMGIGIINPTQRLELDGGVKMNTAEVRPACDATTRGTFWFTQNDVSGDSAEVCARVSGTYSWRKLF